MAKELGDEFCVAPLQVEEIDPRDFAEDETQYAYYLKHLATVANVVVMEGDEKGFLDLVVWRNPKDNKPHNARVLENHISLTFFYVTDRPWNPYFGDLALKARIEAILVFLYQHQNKDGRFSEYAPDRFTLAPTSFGVRVLGETLRMLRESELAGGPVIDDVVRDRAIEMTRKAMDACLDHPDLLKTARSYSNQYVGFWGGVMAFLSAYPDGGLRQRLVERIRNFHSELVSPVGYYYERSGCDWAYTMRTHRNSIRQLWHYIRDTDMAELIAEADTPWIEWMSYNAVLEPDGQYFTLNQAIETRRHQPGFDFWDTPVAEKVPSAIAFHRTDEEMGRDYAQGRESLLADWPVVDELTDYLPSAFFDHTQKGDWCPTEAERNHARAQLPYLKQTHFTHLRMDDRFALHHTYVRRPSYYAIFNSGEVIYQTQRYGLGLVWHPAMGTVLQTQSRDTGPWGTALPDEDVYERKSFQPSINIDSGIFDPVPGKQDLPDGEVVFEYAFGDMGQKRVTFTDSHIEVVVKHDGMFVEHLPLLMREGDELRIDGGELRLQRADCAMVIACESEEMFQIREANVCHGPFELQRVVIDCGDELQYRIAFDDVGL